MTATEPHLDLRELALRRLRRFGRLLLPGILRRIASWKELPDVRLRQFEDDLTQELALDCLAAPDQIVDLPERQLHTRWMRLVDRWVYRQCTRPGLHRVHSVLDDLPAPPKAPLATDTAWLPELVLCKNGRCNLRATAALRGRSIPQTRRLLTDLATNLDGTPRHVRFWQRRFAEALTGLGADLLARRRTLHCLPTGQALPDPERRLQRLRRLTARFAFHDTATDVRHIVACWRRRKPAAAVTPRLPLEQAVALAPERPEGWLWLFEATLDEGDVAAAARALRGCHRHEVHVRGRAVLARARLLEARGRWPAALALLDRARRRWPGDAWLQRAWRQLSAGRGHAPAE